VGTTLRVGALSVFRRKAYPVCPLRPVAPSPYVVVGSRRGRDTAHHRAGHEPAAAEALTMPWPKNEVNPSDPP